jgi:hypothetical protein
MSAQLIPMRWYRFRPDAERAQQSLEASGISSVIHTANIRKHAEDASTDAGGFDLCIDADAILVAKAILRDADISGAICEDCQVRPATMHLTDWQNGIETTRHLCQECGHG